MKTLSIAILLLLLITTEACQKSRSETERSVAYIAYFQKDSLNIYLKPYTTADTAEIRKKLIAYAGKVLKDRALPETLIQSSFYNSVNSTGVILWIGNDQQVSSLRLDKRIDSLHKSIDFQAF